MISEAPSQSAEAFACAISSFRLCFSGLPLSRLHRRGLNRARLLNWPLTPSSLCLTVLSFDFPSAHMSKFRSRLSPFVLHHLKLYATYFVSPNTCAIDSSLGLMLKPTPPKSHQSEVAVSIISDNLTSVEDRCGADCVKLDPVFQSQPF